MSLPVIDLSRLSAPLAVETLDFEAILVEVKEDLLARYPDAAAVLALESEPLVKLMEAFAWRELMLRARINDAYRASTLAFSTGADLDQVGAFHGVPRKAGEADTDYRARIQQGYWRIAAAGPAGALVAHALDAAPEVHGASAWSDGAGRAVCAVLARQAVLLSSLSTGQQAIALGLTDYAFASAPTLDQTQVYRQAEMLEAPMQAVRLRLLSDQVLPLGLDLAIRPAEVLPVTITARLVLLPGPDAEIIRGEALARLDEHLRLQAQLGSDLARAGLHAALFAPGVSNVWLESPANDVICAMGQIAVPTAITVTVEEARNV